MFRKLSKSELAELGYSPKSERYKDTTTGEIVSKRQYQKQQRGSTYTQFRKEIAAGTRQYKRAPVKGATSVARVTKTKYRGTTRSYENMTLKNAKAVIKRYKGTNKVVSVSINVGEEQAGSGKKYHTNNLGVSTRYLMNDYTPGLALRDIDDDALSYVKELNEETTEEELNQDYTFNVLVRERKKQ